MSPKPSQPHTAELFRPRLYEQNNMKHPLGPAGRDVRLGGDRAHLRGVVHLRLWPPSLGSALGGWPAVPAAHLLRL